MRYEDRNNYRRTYILCRTAPASIQNEETELCTQQDILFKVMLILHIVFRNNSGLRT